MITGMNWPSGLTSTTGGDIIDEEKVHQPNFSEIVAEIPELRYMYCIDCIL